MHIPNCINSTTTMGKKGGGIENEHQQDDEKQETYEQFIAMKWISENKIVFKNKKNVLYLLKNKQNENIHQPINHHENKFKQPPSLRTYTHT